MAGTTMGFANSEAPNTRTLFAALKEGEFSSFPSNMAQLSDFNNSTLVVKTDTSRGILIILPNEEELSEYLLKSGNSITSMCTVATVGLTSPNSIQVVRSSGGQVWTLAGGITVGTVLFSGGSYNFIGFIPLES